MTLGTLLNNHLATSLEHVYHTQYAIALVFCQEGLPRLWDRFNGSRAAEKVRQGGGGPGRTLTVRPQPPMLGATVPWTEVCLELAPFWLRVAFAFGLGATVGSFLNVIVDRLPEGRPVLVSRSVCDTCHRRLSAADLVPVLSYLWLRGRCRSCGTSIPPRLLAVELLTGALFAYVAWAYPDSLLTEGAVLLLYGSLLIVIFFIDLERQLVLDKVVFPALPLALALAPWGPPATEAAGWDAYFPALAGGALSLALFGAIYLAARGGMGFGDVKLGALVGLMVGTPLVLVAVPLAFIAGGAVAGLLLATGRKSLKSPIPSATFLAGATVAAMLWGRPLLAWYLGLFS